MAFGLSLIGIRIPILFIMVVVGVAWKNTRRYVGSTYSHGSAAVARFQHLIRHRLLCMDGLILGTDGMMPRPTWREGLSALGSPSQSSDMACYLFLKALGGRKWAKDRMIRIKDFTHLATFAPTGRGKSIYVLIPNLLSYRHSCVVTDPKGELYLATGPHRTEKFGHRVFLLDPFNVCKLGTHTLNPLDFIDDKADDFLDQCRDFADMLIMRTGKEPDPYWNDAARGVLTAFIAFVCACEDVPEKRTLDTVRDLLSSRHSYAKAMEIMQQVESHGGVIQRLGHMLTWHVDRELGSVLANVQRHTEVFDSIPIARNTASSSFNPLWLRSGRVTIYLCLPHDKLDTLAPLMRVWVGIILRVITRGTPSERNPVLFLLDEAAHLGKIKVLEDAVTLMRGMGIRLWFFFQSIHQVEECYGEKAKTILDNIDTQQSFGTNSFEAADEQSKRIGDTTIAIKTFGENIGQTYQKGEGSKDTGSFSTGSTTNYSDTGRRLYKPEEILVSPEQLAFVFHRNLPVILSWLVAYFDHPDFKNNGMGDPPGLGRTATRMSVALLLVSVLFAAGTFGFLGFDPKPTPPAHVQLPAEQSESNSRPGFYWNPFTNTWNSR
jgi:type IV secretion system protein VirD4